MRYIKYVKISNFKAFGEELLVDFEDTTVLIGPNNAGKTTVIQALTMWQLGVRSFFDTKTQLDKTGKIKQKGKLDTSTGIGINRKDIEQVPNTDTRQLFHKSRIRTGRENEKILILVGFQTESEVKECGVEFKYFKSEVIYCYLTQAFTQDLKLLEKAATLSINLLYPMSGLEREETVLQEGAIRKQIGRGITAGLLRNICYNLHTSSPDDWNVLVNWMQKLFYIKLETPKRLSNDDLILEYNYFDKELKTEKPLDILQAGRGQLQMLLILAFVLWRKESIIMIDEPDAHLEVLRQSQVMEVLEKLAAKYHNQIIIATHSEVIMNESDNLTFLLNGKRLNWDEAKKKTLKSSLREFGIEQYYKAQLTKSVLYLEGTTDKQNVRAIAELLKHPAEKLLTDKVFIYYTQSADLQYEEFELRAGYYTLHKKHFQALAPIVPGLRGLAIFDNDNKNRQDEDSDNGLKIRFWRRYELENYFITPQSVMAFAEMYFRKKDGDMFAPIRLNQFQATFEQQFLNPIFDNNIVLLDLYKRGTLDQQQALYNTNASNKKISALLEKVFEVFAEQNNELILRKSEFYKIAPYCKPEDIDKEVVQKLDELCEVLKGVV